MNAERLVAETPRLVLRPFELEDAPFLLELLNDPGWIANIGDRNVRTTDGARDYLRSRMLIAYERHGFGMYLVALKETGEPVGTCGLVKRDALEDVDLGFAFMPAFRGQGFALEAAAAVLELAATRFGFERVAAIVAHHNARSIRLLEKLGFRYERGIVMPGDDEEIGLFRRSVRPAPTASDGR